MSAVVGQVVRGYPMHRLGDVASIERQVVDPVDITEGTTYVGLENIKSGGAFLDVREVKLGELASAKFRFDDRHVLFGKLRPYLAKIARPSFSGVCSTDILPILPGPDLDRGFLAHFLLQPEQVAIANSLATGANLPRLSPAALVQFRVPVPPLSEQRRIAAILDQTDALRAKRDEGMAKLDTLAHFIFLDMFGDPIGNGWKMASIEDVAQKQAGAIRTGPFGSQLLHSEFTDSGVAVLGIDNAVHNEFRWGERRFISDEKYRELLRYTVRPGDVLITIMGTCGRCAIVPNDIPPAINTKHLCCITLDRKKCLPSFLHAYFLRHPLARSYLAQKAKGAIMEGLNMGIIKGMPVPRAPIALQEKFDQILKGLNSVLADQRCSEKYLEALIASLKHRAFRGEL